jgi:hypothetical protein
MGSKQLVNNEGHLDIQKYPFTVHRENRSSGATEGTLHLSDPALSKMSYDLGVTALKHRGESASLDCQLHKARF